MCVKLEPSSLNQAAFWYHVKKAKLKVQQKKHPASSSWKCDQFSKKYTRRKKVMKAKCKCFGLSGP